MAFKTEALKPNIGTRIFASKDDLLSGKYAAEIRVLLEQRGVLVFPQANFSDDEQVTFTGTLGTLAPELKGETIFKVTLDTAANAHADYLKGSMYWHIDGTMNDVPILASILSAKYLPPEGGQTDFCNTYAAYEALPGSERAIYDRFKVMHAAWNSLFFYDPEPNQAMLEGMMAIGDNEIPLVWKHGTGRKSLVLGATAYQIMGQDAKESARILNKLREWATQANFVYRHDWTVGDTVIWDNTGTMHRALPYDPKSGRLLHRTKLEGEEAFA